MRQIPRTPKNMLPMEGRAQETVTSSSDKLHSAFTKFRADFIGSYLKLNASLHLRGPSHRGLSFFPAKS